MRLRELGEWGKKKCSKIKIWGHDGAEWLTYGVSWNFFPILVAVILTICGRVESPFVAIAGTYSMTIFSVSISALCSANKLGKYQILPVFSLLLSVVLYVTVFSDFVSPTTETGTDISFIGQLAFLIVLTLLLIWMIFRGVKMTRELAKKSEDDLASRIEQTLAHKLDQEQNQGQGQDQGQSQGQGQGQSQGQGQGKARKQPKPRKRKK